VKFVHHVGFNEILWARTKRGSLWVQTESHGSACSITLPREAAVQLAESILKALKEEKPSEGNKGSL
jgi:hypothetical protein